MIDKVRIVQKVGQSERVNLLYTGIHNMTKVKPYPQSTNFLCRVDLCMLTLLNYVFTLCNVNY